MFCDVPYAGRFKLGVFGVFVSFILFILGMFPPYGDMTVKFPLLWVASLLVLLASLTVYYDVKEKFWVAVAQKYPKK